MNWRNIGQREFQTKIKMVSKKRTKSIDGVDESDLKRPSFLFAYISVVLTILGILAFVTGVIWIILRFRSSNEWSTEALKHRSLTKYLGKWNEISNDWNLIFNSIYFTQKVISSHWSDWFWLWLDFLSIENLYKRSITTSNNFNTDMIIHVARWDIVTRILIKKRIHFLVD